MIDKNVKDKVVAGVLIFILTSTIASIALFVKDGWQKSKQTAVSLHEASKAIKSIDQKVKETDDAVKHLREDVAIQRIETSILSRDVENLKNKGC